MRLSTPEYAATLWCPFASVATNVVTGPSSANRGAEVMTQCGCLGPRCHGWEWDDGSNEGTTGYCAMKIERTR